MKIEDNFLAQGYFDKLQAIMMGADIAWYFNDGIDYRIRGSDEKLTYSRERDRNKFQFTHAFYDFNRPTSRFFGEFESIFEKVYNQGILARAKANLLTKTPKGFAEVESDVVSKYTDIDFHSCGIKCRRSSTSFNSAHTFFIMAFAETPFKYTNAVM